VAQSLLFNSTQIPADKHSAAEPQPKQL